MNETCGCCKGVEKLTPKTIANRPGLDALIYRVGTHSSFLTTMLARLSSHYLPPSDGQDRPTGNRPLHGLTTRALNDPAIALLDAWAVVADVLTFYQERIANEGYLRTATERRSVLELARLVGYTLRPGVAASVFLAYTLDEGSAATIPKGSRAQSLPAPPDLPQSFETGEDLEARAEWNVLKPRMSRPQYITAANAPAIETLYFKGTATNLRPNDAVLLVFGPSATQTPAMRLVKTAEPQAAFERTKVTFQTEIAPQPAPLDRLEELVAAMIRAQPGGSRRAGEVAGTLNAFMAKLPARVGGADLADRIERDLLPGLREQLAFASVRGQAALEPWLRDMVDVLDDEVHRLRVAAGTTTGGANGSSNGKGSLDGSVVVATRNQLLAPLRVPPSLQPAHARRLERDIRATFSPQQDTGTQVLVALNPTLQDTLYPAMRNATVASPPELQSVEALRVKATPFGSSAPRRPVFDSRGALDGYEEWPLVEQSISIRIGLGVGSQTLAGAAGAEAAITITEGGETQSGQVPLENDQSIVVGGVSVRINIRNDGMEIAFTLERAQPALRREYLLRGENNQLAVSVDNTRTPLVSPGQTVRSRVGDHKITVSVEVPVVATTARRRTAALADPQSPQIVLVDQVGLAVPEEARAVVALDGPYNEITPDSWVVIERPNQRIIGKVVSVQTVSKADFGISAKVTQLTLDRPWLSDADTSLAALRETTIYAQSEPAELVDEPIDDDVQGSEIEVDRLYGGLQSGRWLIVAGERTDIPGTSGVMASELVMLAGAVQGVEQLDVEGQPGGYGGYPGGYAGYGYLPPTGTTTIARPGDKVHTTVQLAKPLAYRYKRDTVAIYGNVVKATHGETRTEALGSGDGSKALQSFALRQSPLTYLAAVTPIGAESTLHVFVNDIEWYETDTLVYLKPTDHNFITRTGDDDKTSVIFGNGWRGARLPTGQENVKAIYRSGIGRPGNVKAGQISLLVTRPLGVRSVINPLPATGGADRESRDEARRNAPLGVTALDRLISVRDYEDFSRTFAGIGKASATRLSDGRRQLVHVTIAGARDIPIDVTSDLYRSLREALHQFGDPYQALQVDLRELVVLVINARVKVRKEYRWVNVEPKIRAALLDRFSFERRDLGQDALLSEVIAAIQLVEGVDYVDVDVLDSVAEGTAPADLERLAGSLALKNRITANMARVEQLFDTVREGRTPPQPETLTDIAARNATTVDGLLRLNPRLRGQGALAVGDSLLVRRGIRPAQIAFLLPDVADTLILREISA